jgi:hypothetical protein
VLRVLDVYPGSEFFPSWIPDPNFFHPGSQIHIKELKYFNPKKWFLSACRYDTGCSSRIRIRIFYSSRTRIQGSKRHRFPDLDPQHYDYLSSRWSKNCQSTKFKLTFSSIDHWCGFGSGRIAIIFSDPDLFQPNVKQNYTF